MNAVKFQKFIPFTKVDSDERMVYGWASTEDIDSDGEIIKADALEKALPAYLKFPTIREMHQPKAVGTTKNAEIKKENKKNGLYIGAKIIANDAWEMVKAGVYPGFSIGGNIIKRVGNVIHELELVEISLVDVPANKAAVVEIWKRGKITKDAETAYSLANLMIQIKDAIYYYEYLGKDTKKLTKALELIKQLLSQEAAEPEHIEHMKGMFTGTTAQEIQKKIIVLEAMDLSHNSFANIIRKGVIMSMNQKVEELEKKDDPETVVESEDDKSKETKEGESTETVEETTEEATDATEVADATEEKEAGDLALTLQKISDVDKTIEKLTPSKEEVKKNNDLIKAVSSMAGSLAKVAETLVSIESRVAKLEETPAAPKSKSAVVLKSIAQVEETTVDESKNAAKADLLATKKARLAELNKKYDTLGAHAFAKQGLSLEAIKLQDEISELSK